MKFTSFVSDKKRINAKTKAEERTGEIYITAELSHRNFDLIKTGQLSVVIPEGVEMENRPGSRVLDFICEDVEIAKVLVDAIENSGMNWEEKEVKEVSLSDLGV
jgi:hypothetical protein